MRQLKEQEVEKDSRPDGAVVDSARLEKPLPVASVNGSQTNPGSADTAGGTADIAEPSAPKDVGDKHLIMRQASMLSVIAEFIDQRSLSAGLTALAGELHNRFPCERVVVGLYHRGYLSVTAISQQATIESKSAEVRLLADAMREACDQETQIHFPSSRRELHVIEAHRALCAGREHAEVLTLPLCHQGEIIGALLLERTSTHSLANLSIELLRQIAEMMAPIIALRRDGEQDLLDMLRKRVGQALPNLLKPRHVIGKIAAVLIVGLFIAAYFSQVAHRVTAQAELVPTERRVITAPMAGYIETVSVRAGDRVSLGQPMLALDSRDLQLERAKWENELSSSETEFRSAMAGHDRNEMAVTQARSKQAQAQLDLIMSQLARAQLLSPADGLVMNGDLSQSLGAPVERGEVLFEIAPTDGYEVHLLVDEADIPYIKAGQLGELALKANPGDAISFEVRAVHPIAQPGEGLNRFRVEALLNKETTGLRPGQTGVGKVSVGEASLLWVWTHRFVEWSQRQIWEWLG